MAAAVADCSRRALLGGLPLTVLGMAGAQAQSALGTPAAVNLQAPKRDDTTGAGYTRIVIARWGDAVLPDAPPFTPDALTTDEASTQFPYDAVITGLITPPPAQDGIPRLVAVFANPTAPAHMVFPGGIDNPAVAGRLQGATVMNLQYMNARWVTVDGGYQSRRLDDGTLCEITGPVAGSIGGTVQGVLAPLAGCTSPWATALLTEGDATSWLTRLAGTDPDLADPTAGPRFGWVVEFDPMDPLSIPAKRTALGCLARAGIAATTTADGRAVIFMSQEAPDGMLFRFISATAASDGTMLDTGTLAVAKITGNAISWVTLGSDVPSLAGLAGAAQTAGGSAFDAPGGIALGSGVLYLACGGNPDRDVDSVNPLNPRAGDDNGHILAFHPPGGDVTAGSFPGEVAIAAGNPATAAYTQYTPGSASWFRKPRTLDLDPQGQLWIGTDQQGSTTDTADGLFVMQTGGPSKYLVDTAYLAPIGAAIGGAGFDAASRTAFGMVRHPGATPSASFDNPATRWPMLLPDMPPQSTVIGLVAK